MITKLHKFELGSKAYLDRHLPQEGILVNIQAVTFRNNSDATYEVSWLANGMQQEVWVNSWRLTKPNQE